MIPKFCPEGHLILIFIKKYNHPLCIPLGGNNPLHRNAVCILFISSEQIGIFSLNFAALIQVLKKNYEIPIFKF